MTPRRRKIVFVLATAAALGGLLWAFQAVLVPFVLALVIAYVLSPVVAALTRLRIGRRRLPRWAAVLLLYAGLLSGVGIFSVYFLPRLADELAVMMREVPAAFRHVREEWLPAVAEAYEENLSPLLQSRRPDVITRAEGREEAEAGPRSPALRLIPEGDGGYRVELEGAAFEVRRSSSGEGYLVVPRAPPGRAAPGKPDGLDLERSLGQALRELLERGQEHATVLFSLGQEVVVFLFGFAFTFFITLMLSAFILVDQHRILAFVEGLFPRTWRPDVRQVIESLDRGLAGVVRGQLLICLINGVLTGIGLAFFDLRYWPVLTAIVTVFTLIPIFGTIISSAPAILIALTQSWTTALGVAIWITVVHGVEAYLLEPRILGRTARIHPVVIFFSLIAGVHVGGLLGALLAVPVASILQNIFLYWKERTYRDEAEDRSGDGESPELAPAGSLPPEPASLSGPHPVVPGPEGGGGGATG